MDRHIPTLIETTANRMVTDGLTSWQDAQTVLNELGWTGGAVRIAAVQASQLADAIRANNP